MAKLGDLPAGFDPEQHLRPTEQARELSEGINVVQYDPQTGFHLVAKVTKAAEAVSIRCWHCYKRPDGSFDCFAVKCPWDAAFQVSRPSL